MLLHCAVIGNPVTHSLSPLIHQAFAKQINLSLSYKKILGDDRQFEQQVLDFFAQGGKGLNVTMPYKQRAFYLAETASQRSLRSGAANTLWFNNGRLQADNTDGIGLMCDLKRYVAINNAKVLVLGSGGAARGIIPALLEAKPNHIVVTNRSKESLIQFQKDFPEIQCSAWLPSEGEFNVLINATSAGLSGETISLPPELLSTRPFCYDLVYQLKKFTPFVAYAQQQGCLAVDGFGMLVEQAAESFAIWHGIRPVTAPVLEARTKLSR